LAKAKITVGKGLALGNHPSSRIRRVVVSGAELVLEMQGLVRLMSIENRICLRFPSDAREDSPFKKASRVDWRVSFQPNTELRWMKGRGETK
jgi:hypothetical protein